VTVNANSREKDAMCLIGDVFPDNDLKPLSKKRRDALQEYGKLLVLTNPTIRKLIKHSIKKDPGPGIRKKLKALLGPELKRLKSL
jgi:hypothetical protein